MVLKRSTILHKCVDLNHGFTQTCGVSLDLFLESCCHKDMVSSCWQVKPHHNQELYFIGPHWQDIDVCVGLCSPLSEFAPREEGGQGL